MLETQNLESVKKAFSLQSKIFDEYEERNDILKWMRSVTREHFLRHLKKGDNILELNAGTGLDAVFLAQNGFNVHAIDISEGMLEKLRLKVEKLNLKDAISFELLSFTELDKIQSGPFDYIFSNFGGLNCVSNLSTVTKHFRNVLNSKGKVTLVIMPPVCLWEIALVFRGKFNTAARRLHKEGVIANIEGVEFETFYHSINNVVKALGQDFKLIEAQGLAFISPPPYMINFPKRYPKLYRKLTGLDKKLSHVFPFNRWADHFIVTFEYRPK